MRTVHFLSGMPGSGKSTIIQQNEIESLTLSLDSFRLIYSGLETDHTGLITISQDKNDLVYKKYIEALRMRLQMGGNLFIDNLNPKFKDISEVLSIIKEYDYDYKIIEFPLEPFDFYISRNNQRPKYKRLPETTLAALYKVFKERDFPKEKVFTVEEVFKEFNATSEDLLEDISNYEKIHFIGDLQGSFSPLKEYFDKNNIKDNELYVFVGDYIDRGIENDKCIEFLLNNLYKKNFVFIMGNHEKNLYNCSNNIGLLQDVFEKKTLPQLEENGITKEKMKEAYRGMHLFKFFKYNDKKLFISHAGLPTVPDKPNFLNFDQFMRGFGPYSYDIDKRFNELNTDNEWYQIHGHRNQNKLMFNSYAKSITLESGVEFGGNLSIVQLDKKGFNGFLIHNRIFDKEAILEIEKEKGMFFKNNNSSKLSDFLNDKVHSKNGLEIINMLRATKNVEEIVSKEKPFISIFKLKDKLISSEIKGLNIFFNNLNGEIISRGFDDLIKLDDFKSKLTAPITLYENETGFLGFLGYDSQSNKLIYTSKTSADDFESILFEKIMNSKLSTGELEYLKIFSNKHNISYVFEINDPINYPDVIKKSDIEIKLISVIKKDLKYSELCYNYLLSFAEDFEHISAKKILFEFKNIQSFNGFHNSITKESALTSKKQIEGYFINDRDLNISEFKTPYYNFWTAMKDTINLLNMEKSEINIVNIVNNDKRVQDIDKQNAILFLNFFNKLPANIKLNNIIELREVFLNNINSTTLKNKPKQKP